MKRSRDEYQIYSYAEKPLRGILSTFQFDVVGYDCRVRDYTIEVVDSPAVVGIELDCHFPAYLVDEQLSLWLPRTMPADHRHAVAARHRPDHPGPDQQAAGTGRLVQPGQQANRHAARFRIRRPTAACSATAWKISGRT